MKILSSESFSHIVYLIQGQNYANIYAHLCLQLDKRESDLFAKIVLLDNSAQWLAEEHDYQQYTVATAQEKEEVAFYIDNIKESVLQKLANKSYTNELFRVPSEDHIFWCRDVDGKIRVVLTQWGFSRVNAGRDVDIIDFILNQPRILTQQDVIVHVDYSNGEPANEMPLDLTVFGNTKPVTTDGDGNYSLGKMFGGTSFVIADNKTNKRVEFVVENGKNVYNAIFDLYTDYSVTVLNQKDEPKRLFNIFINEESFKTNDEGKVVVENIPLLSKDTSIAVVAESVSPSVYKLNRDKVLNDFIYRVPDKPQPPPSPSNDDTSVTIVSDSKKKDEDMKSNSEKQVKIHLLDYDGKPLPNLEVSVDTRNGKLTGVTDAEGYVSFPMNYFPNKKRVKLHFLVSEEYRQSLINEK